MTRLASGEVTSSVRGSFARVRAPHIRAFCAKPLFRRTVILAGLIAVWEVWVSVAHVSSFIFPPFHDVVAALYDNLVHGSLWSITWSTLSVVFEAYIISVLLALVLTALAVTNSWGRDFLNTVTGIFQPLPSIALLPMAILWFGLSRESLLFVVVMSMTWPVAAALTTGFATAPQTLLRLGQNYEVGIVSLFCRILLPSALPSLIGGLRVGWGYGWRTVVAAELIFGTTGAAEGLGYFINVSRLYLKTADSIAGILVVIILGLIVEAIFRLVQRRTTVRWGMERM